MEDTLVLERYVNEELLKLHKGHDDDAHVRILIFDWSDCVMFTFFDRSNTSLIFLIGPKKSTCML